MPEQRLSSQPPVHCSCKLAGTEFRSAEDVVGLKGCSSSKWRHWRPVVKRDRSHMGGAIHSDQPITVELGGVTGAYYLDRYRPTSDNSAAYNAQHLLRFELHSFGYIPP